MKVYHNFHALNFLSGPDTHKVYTIKELAELTNEAPLFMFKKRIIQSTRAKISKKRHYVRLNRSQYSSLKKTCRKSWPINGMGFHEILIEYSKRKAYFPERIRKRYNHDNSPFFVFRSRLLCHMNNETGGLCAKIIYTSNPVKIPRLPKHAALLRRNS